MKIELLATVFFAMALLHSFCVTFVARLARRYKSKRYVYPLLHALAEVEIVFGFWAIIFLICWSVIEGPAPAWRHQLSLNLIEPLFIFCIMVMASTRAIVTLARRVIFSVSVLPQKLFKIDKLTAQFLTLMIFGPLVGSFITEPAAITITALLLYRMINSERIEGRTLYALLALLFVNISVGGALTHFAAPPILVVARTWGWQLSDVFINLGSAAIATVFLNTTVIYFIFKKQLKESLQVAEEDHYPIPYWVLILHLVLLALLILNAHNVKLLTLVFCLFIGLALMTKKHQDALKFKESALVAFFLYGLIVFGSLQRWWIEPLILSLNSESLFLGAAALTAVTDNAALTYLGSQVPGLSELSKWALVGGALVGGGLTILANAPNAAGFAVLSSKFPDGSLSAAKLFKAALLPTFIALCCFAFKIFY
jgi:hypothetical protein